MLQAASEVPANPKEHLVDIDAADVQDELAVIEYIDDLYKYYKLTEVLMLVPIWF